MSDHDLLRRYAAEGSQPAFAELVSRHLDLVYSAARRQVRSPQLAEEIAQSVFLDLARQAGAFPAATPLVAWLHLVTRRTAIDTIRREARRAAREQAAGPDLVAHIHLTPMSPDATDWSAVEPLLDEAVESLDPTDRAAILLRFFENKSLREVGAALGTSDDAAQKRVSRAVDQLRDFLLQRGVAVTAAGLTADLSAHALQLAPAALGASITSAAASVTALAPVATVASTTALLAKPVLVATAVAVVGAAVIEIATLFHTRRALAATQAVAAQLGTELQLLATKQSAADQHLDSSRHDLSRLTRVNVGSDPELEAAVAGWLARVARLKSLAATRPDLALPELAALADADWFRVAKLAKLDDDAGLRDAFTALRKSARESVAAKFHGALTRYAAAHAGQLPESPHQLASYLPTALPEALYPRYEMLQRGPLAAANDDWVLAERAEIAAAFDDRAYVRAGSHGLEDTTTVSDRLLRIALRAFVAANRGALPSEPAQLLHYFRTAPTAAALKSFLAKPKSEFLPAELQKLLQND